MNIIVTGCSSGIGFEVVKLFLQNKENKVMGIARNAEPLNALQLQNSNFIAVPTDITKLKHIDFIDIIKSYFSEVNILINNAGMLVNSEFNRVGESEVEKLFATNLFAPATLIKACVNFMGNKQRAHVVNIGSMGGFLGSAKFSGLAWYSTSKAALACLTECLAEEFKHVNISFNCLALGAVQTEMLTKAFPGYNAPVSASNMAKYIVEFAMNGQMFYNGKVLPVSLSTP